MSEYRDNTAMDSLTRGRAVLQMRTLVRRGTLFAVVDNEVYEVVVSDGETRPMDSAQPIGLVARPKDPTRTEVVAVNVASNSKAPVAVAVIDWDRQLVIDRTGIDADTTILHNSLGMVKITAAGQIWIGAQEGTLVQLATKADVESVNTRIESLEDTYNEHVHAVGSPNTGIPLQQSDTSATIEGTEFIREVQT